MSPSPSRHSELSSRVAVLSAYLTPLLEKHAQGDYITYEDLQSSHEHATLALEQSQPQPQSTLTVDNTDDDIDDDTDTIVAQELQALHESQLQAYRAHAEQALFQWFVENVELPTPPDSSSMQAFSRFAKECMASGQVDTDSQSSMPHYPIFASKHQHHIHRIRQRAILQKAHNVFYQSHNHTKHTTTNDTKIHSLSNQDEQQSTISDPLSSPATDHSAVVDTSSNSMETIPEDHEMTLASNNNTKRKRPKHDSRELEEENTTDKTISTNENHNGNDNIDDAATTTSTESNQSLSKKKTRSLPSSALTTPPKKVLKKRRIPPPNNNNTKNKATAASAKSSSSTSSTGNTSTNKQSSPKKFTTKGIKKQPSKIPTLSKKTLVKKTSSRKTTKAIKQTKKQTTS